MSDNAYPPQPKQHSGSGVVKWLLIIGLVLLLFVGGCVAMLIWGANSVYTAIMKPPQDLLEFLKQDPQVIERLGDDVEIMTLLDSGRFTSTINNNEAEVAFDLRGSRDRAAVDGTMRYSEGKWVPQNIVIRFNDGTTINYP